MTRRVVVMLGVHDTVTIWNRHRNKETKKDEWVLHVVEGCSWECEIEATTTDKGAVVGGSYSVMIAEHEDYRDYLSWKQMGPEERARYFTLNAGDLIALGEIATEISGVEPYRMSDVQSELLPNAFIVKAFADESQKHKLGRHYMVKGV